MNASLDLEEVLRRVLEAMKDAFGFERSMILLPVPGDAFEVRAILGPGQATVGTQLPMGAGPVGVVARRKKLVRIASTGAPRRYAEVLRTSADPVSQGPSGVESLIVVPMLAGNELVGVVQIESHRVLAFEPEDEQLVVTVANLAASAIRNASLYQALSESNRSALRFVPHEFVRFLDKSELRELARGQCVNRSMTVLFSDLRSFTAAVEKLDPAATFELLNGYLAAMVPRIEARRGFVDKFIGDAIMALFDDATPDAALQSAVEQHRALERLNREHGGAPLGMGIGLHRGPLTLGVVGSAERLSCTVYGDTVNLASRVEALTRTYGARVLVTDATVEALADRDAFDLRFVDRVRVKGKEAPVGLWESLAALPEAEHAARAPTEALREPRGAYDAGRFAEAERVLEEVCARYPDDAVPRVWLARCREWASAPPASWDGATRLDRK